MKFAAFNQYAWLIWLVPGMVLLFALTGLRRRRLTERLIAREYWSAMIPGIGRARRKLKAALFLLGLSFLLLAMLRPQWGFELREVKRKGVDIYTLVDTSDSMLAQDILPNRMERAKRELKDLSRWLNGDRIGLIPFAGKAYTACPLTSDYETFELFLDQLDTDLVPIQGTDLAGAITMALDAFQPEESRSKAILLLTDGELTQGSLDSVVNRSREAEVGIFIIGMGTPAGAPIPLREGNGFKTDEKGSGVISKLNEAALKELAQATGGRYARSVTGDGDLEEVYLKGIKEALEDEELKSGQRRIPLERFQIPLAIGIFFLILESLVQEGKKEGQA